MALGTIGTIIGLAGAGTSAISNILKGQEQDEYARKAEKAEKAELARLEKERRRDALARYIGVGSETSLLPSKKTSQPKRPYTSGYDVASGIGGLTSILGGGLNKLGSK